MDRNTRIAFGLIFLLFVVYFVYISRFAAPPPPAGTEQTTTSTTSETTVPPTGDIAVPVADTEVVADTIDMEFGDAPRRALVVDTGVARFYLDSRGAVVTRIELLDFTGIDSEFVELIGTSDGQGGAEVLSLEIFSPSGVIDSGDWNFDVEGVGPDDRLTLDIGDQRTVTFLAGDGQGGQLTKNFTFSYGKYDFQLGIQSRLGGSLTGAGKVVLEWDQGILSTEKNRKDEIRSFNNFFQVGDTQKKKSLRNFKGAGGNPGSAEWSSDGTIQWAATRSKYFMSAGIPTDPVNGRVGLVGDSQGEYLGWRMEYPVTGGMSVYNGDFNIYCGPIDFNYLKSYNRNLESLVDMGKMIRPISLALKWLMDFLHRFIPNYGVIIILMSVITKVLFYRLSNKSFKSMKDMQAVQPELKALQDKYKDNKEKLNKATMELYKEHGVNPLGGCLPLLLQMPVFFALYRVLRSAVELRGAGFFGWIHDLSNMDVIYALPFNIPVVGGFIDNSISVLPILMGLSMWAQQKLGGTGMGMSSGSQPANQMAAMNKIMPFFMTFIFYRMPSGLVLYWLVNNILTVVQQYYIHKGHQDTPKVVTAS
jgi:YidC/Oxa1 family membrane protein insertase